MIHFLEPVTTAFQAEVALGSLWKVEPERGGPMMSHLKSGRPASPSTENKSSSKYLGTCASNMSSHMHKNKQAMDTLQRCQGRMWHAFEQSTWLHTDAK